VATIQYGNFGRAQEDVIRISKATGISVAATGDLYSKLNMSLGEMGYSQASVARVTETFQKAMVAGGVATQQAQAAVLQFGQAIASGRLGGDEFKSLSENAPYFMSKLRQSLGLTQAEFRRMSEEGRLTPEIIIPAMRKMADSVTSDSGKMQKSIGQAAEILRTNLIQAFIEFDEENKVTEKIANGILKLSDNLDKAAIVAGVFVGTLVLTSAVSQILTMAAAIRSATTAMALFNAVVGKNPLVKIALAIASVTATVLALQEDQTANQDVLNAKADERNRLDEIQIANEKIKKTLTADQIKAFAELEISIRKMGQALEQEQLKYQLPPSALEARRLIFEEEQKLVKVGQTLGQQQRDRITLIAQQTQAAKIQNAEIEKQIQVSKQLADAYDGPLVRAVKNFQLATQEYNRVREMANKGQLDDIKQLTEADKGQLEGRKQIQQAISVAMDYQIGTRLKLEQDYLLQVKDANLALDTLQQQLGITQTERLAQQKMIEFELHNEYLMKLLQADQDYANRSLQVRQATIYQQMQAQGNSMTQQVLGQQGMMDAARTRAEFEKKTELQKSQFAIDQAAQMFTALGQYNKKAFMAAKAFNIANAIMNTYMAATKALATYPPPFSFIAASAAVAMGLAQVAQISSQQYSGRAIGGPVMGNQPYIVGERGPELMVPQGAGKVIPNNQLTNTEPMVINLNIQAVDARGVDQLIMERKGMIVGMIRSAMNDRGARAPL
jgi:tape measure domain-containing protein